MIHLFLLITQELPGAPNLGRATNRVMNLPSQMRCERILENDPLPHPAALGQKNRASAAVPPRPHLTR